MNLYKIIESDLTGIGRYSFSRLSAYHTCQHQYNQYYNNRKSGNGNAFASYGTMAHSILESYFRSEVPLDNLKDEYVQRFSEECSDGIQMFIPTKDGGFFQKDLTNLYYEGGLEFFEKFDGLKEMDVLGVEEDFDILINYKDVCFILNGFIDLIAQDKDGNLYVIDHKSKGKFKSVAEKNEYRRQLALYSIYAMFKYKMPVKEAWFNQFRINHIEKFEMTDEIIEEALEWAANTVMDIESESLWLPNTSDRFYCRNLCDMRDQCVYFNEGE